MRLIPVLDVMNGQVMRAIGGRRDAYAPVRSTLTPSTDPRAVAEALLLASGADELYIADLDAITGTRFQPAVVGDLLNNLGVPVWADVGIGRMADVLDLPANDRLRPVVGFETANTWEVLLETRMARGFGRVALSIDLRGGELIGNWRGWGLSGPRDAVGLAGRAVGCGVETVIVLDLARVGAGSGAGTEAVCEAIRVAYPAVELIAGGGVRGWDDVDRLAAAGVDGVLVASALHDGTMGRRG